VNTVLSEIVASNDPHPHPNQYNQLLDQFIEKNAKKELEAFVVHMLDEKTPLVISRTLLQAFATNLTKLPSQVHKEIAHFALEKIQPRVVAFEEQVSVIRVNLAKLYEERKNGKKLLRF